MASPAHELADFTSPRVLITVRGWPEQVCPVTNEHLSTLLTALQQSLPNNVVTLQASVSNSTKSATENYFCVSAPCLANTNKSDIGVRRPSIVMDVTVWAEVNNSNRPLFIQSIKNAWTTFLNSESETMDFLIQVQQAAIVRDSTQSHTNPTVSLPTTMNSYIVNRSKSTEALDFGNSSRIMASKPPGSPPKLTDGNLLNSGKNELLIKVSYSEEFGTVAACKLDEFLLAVQSIQELWDVRCTVGSRILEKPQSEGTDSVQAESSTGTAVANDLEVTRYYCKTALSYNGSYFQLICRYKEEEIHLS